MLQKHTLRLDPATAAAVAACAHAERKTTTDVMREGIRLRLEVGALIEPIRLAIVDIEAAVIQRIEQRFVSLQTELVTRVVETEERERAITRADITDFIAGLGQYEEASRSPSSYETASAPMSPHDQLSK